MNDVVLNENVNPGLHPYALQNIQSSFSDVEQDIVRSFGNTWYVTKADVISIGASYYKFILIKAPRNLYDLLNISGEIIVVFSDYKEFEPRTFDAFDNIKNRLELGRVENLCGVIVSNDEQIEMRISAYNGGTETRTIIPFSYKEICDNKGDSFLYRNKFQKYFYSRDLFAFDDALKTDLYFFGRNQLVMEIIDKHLSGQNSGLFGLRKTGKTSILYDVKRKIVNKNAIGIFVSCQNPEMSTGSWVDSIYYVVKCICNEVKLDSFSLRKENCTNLTAVEFLLKAIEKTYTKTQQTVLIMFDEVEHITYKKAANLDWCDGLESVYFWKAIRSAYQMENSHFTYCIAGTNPICVEYPTIKHADNPIFSGITPKYIPGFDVKQTRDMVRRLGRIMGIKFDETLFSKMTEEYGGHPFLIRHLCSFISNKYPDRPVNIDRIKYNQCRDEFNKTQGKYFDMLLEVLTEFYPQEYEMLNYLALDEKETFEHYAKNDYSLVQHIIGYGIIQQYDYNYDFKIDVIKEYILRKTSTKSSFESKEDKWSYLCNQRGNFEIQLRKMVKQVLLLGLTTAGKDAKEYVMSKLYNDKGKRVKYASYDYNDLFDPQKSEIYLRGLSVLIMGQWQLFSSFMNGITQEDFKNAIGILNVEGRFDAHAKIPSDYDMTLFNAAITKLNKVLDNYKLVMN